jgi:twitching motility two-component system response regulator PilH
MIETLKGKGFQIVTAENGEDAITKAKSELPDLILMDVVMPGLNGYQATRQITRDDATKHIPVIMCTSKGADTDKIWGMRQGANDYLVKPVDPQALLAKIAQLSAAN